MHWLSFGQNSVCCLLIWFRDHSWDKLHRNSSVWNLIPWTTPCFLLICASSTSLFSLYPHIRGYILRKACCQLWENTNCSYTWIRKKQRKKPNCCSLRSMTFGIQRRWTGSSRNSCVSSRMFQYLPATWNCP